MRTLGSFFLALQQQAQGEPLSGSSSFSLIEIIAEASPIQKAVLIVLALFSIVSWGIIFYKAWAFGRSARQTASFLEVFRRSNKFSEVQAVCRSLGESPLVGLFQSGYAELTAQLRQSTPNGEPAGSNPKPGAARPTLRSLTAVDRALMRASVVEVNKLEKTDPVSGVDRQHYAVYRALRHRRSASCCRSKRSARWGLPAWRWLARGLRKRWSRRRPGLFVAIPAAYFYNHLSNRVKLFASEMDDFAMEFLNIAERNFT